jgi:hypothetical protein
MSPWEDIEADPEFGTLTPQEKVSLFDDWHKNTVNSFAEIDPEEVDLQGLKGFMASGQVKRRELLGEPVDPDQITQQYLTGLTERNKSQKQMLADYDALEKARFNLQDATLQKGVTSAGDRGMIISPKVQEILGKPKQQAEKEFEIARSKFTPELEQQAREAREAMRGERPVAVLGSDIYTDPSLTLDKEEYRRAVNGTSASPEAKMLALADFSSRRDEFAKNALRAFRVAGEAPIPGMESFASWEAKQPEETRVKSPESKALEYLRQMRGREGYRKLISAIGTGAVQGGADVASQAVGTAAMITGDRGLAQKAGEVQKGAEALSEVQKLEGDMSATGATTAGGVARLGVGMAPAIGAGLLTGGSLPAAALAAGAQTAGAQFPSTYNAMLEQGKSEEEALRASRGAALMSGAVTSALTALGGTSGVEALIRRSGEGFARGRVASILLGSIKEIPEELADEAASQVIESSLTNPDKPVSQVVDEFLGQAPDLALQVGLLGGAGEAFSSGGKTPPTSQPTEETEEPVVLGRTVQQVLDEADAVSARAVVQAEEAGSPLLAQAIAEQTAATVPEAQAETAEPSGQTEPEVAAEILPEKSPAVNAVTTEEQETLPLLPQEEGQAGESRTPAEGSIPAVTAEKMPDTSEVSSVAPSAGVERNRALIAQAATTNAGRAQVSANEYIQKAAAAPQPNLPPITTQGGEVEVQAAPERTVEQNPIAAMAAQAAAKARGEVKEVSAPLARMLQPSPPSPSAPSGLGAGAATTPQGAIESPTAPATAEDIADRINASSLSPATTYPSLVQDIKSLTEGRPARLQEVADALFEQPMQRPTAEKIARRLLDENAAEREVTASRDRRVAREMIGEEENQRGGEAPVSDDKAPLEKGEFVAWQDENGAMQEGVLTKISAGRNNLGEPMSEVTLETSEVVQVPRRELRPMASMRPDARDAEYLAAVEAGDMAKAQRMVDEAAKAAGYNVGPVYHHGGFDIQENAVPDTSRGFHMGTRQAAEERAFGKPVDDFIAEAEVTYDEGLGAWFWSSQGVDSYDVVDEDGFSSEERARRSLEEYASQEDFSGSDIEDLGKLTAAYLRVSNPLVVADQKADWDGVIKRAVSGGYDTVQYRNDFEDKGSTSYIALQEGQIKSADPVTYDDAGNVIPLSQRFQTTSPDIRFSKKPTNPVRDARAAAIKSLRGHLGEEVSVGVSAVDGINAMTSLQGAVPGVQKAWIGTREDFLADESLGRAFPGIRRELESPRGDQLEGLFDGGRAFVFINNVGVYEGDVRVAKEQSELTGEEVTPQQAAVQRVITHEGLVHRGFYALDKDTRRALFQWGAQNIYEAEMDAMAEEYGYADDWRTNERSREWIMEEILAKKIERLKAPPKSGPLKALWDILVSLWRKLTGSVQEVTLKDIQDVAKVLRTALELSENNVETRNGMPIRVEVAKGSLRPRFTSPLDATLSDTAKALRLMRDGPPATPVDLQQAYATAVRGKSSAMVSLDDLFAAAKASAPSLTEAEFGQQVQNLYNDNGAYVESAESPAVMKQSADRYNVRSSQGIPASYVMILETGRPMASMRPETPFYSKLSRVVSDKMPNRADVATIKGIITNPQTGIKAEELKWSGIVPWLDAQEGMVTKQAVLDYLASDGAVRLEEVRMGGQDRTIKPGAVFGDYRVIDDAGDLALERVDDGSFVRSGTAEQLADYLEIGTGESGAGTKYAQYQLPGSENYREVVLAMPVERRSMTEAAAVYYNTFVRRGGEPQWAELPESRRLQIITETPAEAFNEPPEYTSSHFPDVPNYVAHMRLNDRTDAEGQPGTFIEEIQSDRHQQGREKGYQGQRDRSLSVKWDANLQTWKVLNEEGRMVGGFQTEEAAKAAANKFASGIPDAPFRTTWPLQMFKRALADAVAAGKQWIGWTTGETQAERYDLSRQVDKIEVYPLEKSPGMVAITAYKDGRQAIRQDVARGSMADLIGKEAAQKAEQQIQQNNFATLEGDGLKVGGEGMKGFYDTILPKEIGKYVKQWGAGVVKGEAVTRKESFEESPISFDDSPVLVRQQTTPIWRVDITPSMRESIQKEGQPKFSLRPDAARRLNRAVWEAQEASGPIKDSEQTPLKDYPVHSFAQQSGKSRTDVAIQVVDELLKSGVPVNGLVDAINSYELHRQLGIERDPDMLGILLAEAMLRGDPNAFKAHQDIRSRIGRAQGTGAILHKDPRYQHLFLLEGMKDEQMQQARDILNANAPMNADEVSRLDAEAGRTAAAEDAGAVQDALEEDLLEIGEKGLSPKERTLWEKAKYLVARIGYLLKLGSGDAKPSLRFEFPDSEKQALSKLSADERQKELQRTRAELRATLGELLGQRKPRKVAGGVETIEGDLTTRAVADMVQRMQERLNIPVDTATAIDALTTTGNLKGQFENFISDSLISKVKSAMTPKQAPVKNLNSVIRQITSILADNLNLPKAQTAKESLGERALDTFGRVRSNEQMIREAWERSREGIRQYLAERAVEGKEGLTEEEAAEIEEAVDAQLDAIASSVPARMWARGQAYSLIRDALEGSKFGTNEDILRDPQAALKTVQDLLNSEVGKIGNVDPARWDSDQAYIVAAFNSLVADLKERKAKAEARRAGKTRSGLMTGSDKKTLTSLIEQARKRSGDKAPLLPDSATWTKIFSGSPQSQEAKAREMLDYMKADPLLANLTAAEQQQLADMFARRWEKKRKELLEAKVASILKARNATPKGKNAAKDAVPKFIQAINRGELTNDVIAEEIAEKFGFEKLTEGEKKTLERLSRELQEPNLPQHEKTAKIDEMAKIIAKKTRMSMAEILSAWWVTSVLSGPRTAFTIGLAASNGAFEVLGHAVSTVLNANWNGRRAEGLAATGQALTNYFKSWPRAIQLAWQYVLTGDKKLLSAMDPAYSQFFETGRNNPLSVGWRLSQSKNPVARATGRFMHFFEKLLSALDLFTATTTRHGMLPISYYLNQKVYDKARAASETDLANYRKKVIDLWWGGKEPTTGAEQALVTRQSINMMEEQLAKYANVLEDAGFAAAQAAMTLTPEGLGGQFYQAVRSVANKAERSAEKAVREAERLDGKDHGPIERNTRKALAYLYRFLAYQMLNVAGLRFARFAGNKLNQSLGFIPGLGLLRKFEKDYAGPMKNQAIMRNQAIGAMMAMVGYNVLKAIGDEPDDDKRGWGIEGSWKNLTPDQIKQLQAAGRKQYTIHIGEQSYNYANWPVSSVLAAIGTMADRIKYSPDKWKETSTLDKIATGAWAASTATMDASSLSQLAEVFGSNIHTRDPVEASAKWASRVFGNYAGGMIPRVFKDADMILDGKMGKYDGWENFGKEIPVYRRYVGGPLLDIFGKQVEVSRTPWSREFQVQPPEREYRLLGQLNSNDLWLTPANPGGRRVGRGKRSREMTDAEQKRYVTLVGDGYRKVVLKFGDRLAKMDREGAKDLLGKLTAQVRDRAERQAVTQQ